MSQRILVVSGDLGDFHQGQNLQSDTEIVAYIRTILNEGGTDKGISDEDILKAVDNSDLKDSPEDREVSIVEALEMLQGEAETTE